MTRGIPDPASFRSTDRDCRLALLSLTCAQFPND